MGPIFLIVLIFAAHVPQGPDLWEGKGGYACPAKHHGAGPRAAARLLGGLRGRFAFLVWDSVHRRLVAARDHQAQEAIFWGAPTFGEGLLFSTDRCASRGAGR